MTLAWRLLLVVVVDVWERQRNMLLTSQRLKANKQACCSTRSFSAKISLPMTVVSFIEYLVVSLLMQCNILTHAYKPHSACYRLTACLPTWLLTYSFS